jgi:peroxiredoxin
MEIDGSEAEHVCHSQPFGRVVGTVICSSLDSELSTTSPTRRPQMLRRGDQVPHFEVRDLNDQLINYAAIWQRRNLLLVVLPEMDSDATRRYLAELAGIAAAFGESTSSVTTRDAVAGLPPAAALVADQWGEIIFVCVNSDIAHLPSPRELTDWISYVETKCPECEGEAR